MSYIICLLVANDSCVVKLTLTLNVYVCNVTVDCYTCRGNLVSTPNHNYVYYQLNLYIVLIFNYICLKINIINKYFTFLKAIFNLAIICF